MAAGQSPGTPTRATDIANKGYVDAAVLVPTISVTGSKTLALTDGLSGQDSTSATGITITVPPNSSVAFPIGTIIEIAQVGAGQVTVAAGAGVTINSAGALLKTRAQYSAISLRKRATDTWLLSGDLA